MSPQARTQCFRRSRYSGSNRFPHENKPHLSVLHRLRRLYSQARTLPFASPVRSIALAYIIGSVHESYLGIRSSSHRCSVR